MPVSVQLEMMRRLTALIEGANPDNEDPVTGVPYDLDLRNQVIRGKTVIGHERAPPYVSLLEAPVPLDAMFSGDGKVKKSEKVRLLVQGFAVEDKQHPLDPAYKMKAVVETRLARVVQLNKGGDPVFPDDYRLGNLIVDMEVAQGVVRPPEDRVSPTAFFYIPLIVGLATDISKPYVS